MTKSPARTYKPCGKKGHFEVHADPHHYYNSTHILTYKLPFRRLVREIAGAIEKDVRFWSAALDDRQIFLETYLISLFEDAHLCATCVSAAKGFNRFAKSFVLWCIKKS